ncbi:unnamed protein product [Urochloa decumbens]|uniref:F-box domain-containing protein n=1 Tax=Urochloa decumbens TaxID=240449 RepID=A0ABC8XV97_9POAL
MAAGRELPADLIADVLRRLPPRSLAVSRCVCVAWRGLVDTRRLLRADLLPRSVGGIFLNYCALYSPDSPTAGPTISSDLEFVPGISEVVDHCNGILLVEETTDDYVCNPATRRWARVPPCPVPWRKDSRYRIKCLAYDPTVSPHFEVFLIPSLPHPSSHPQSDEWPPSYIDIHVKAKYTMVPKPSEAECERHGFLSLGRSEKGLYCAFNHDSHGLRIFLLNESGGRLGWELKHIVNLESFARKLHAREDYNHQHKGPWMLQDINYYKYPYGNSKRREAVEDSFEWNSDDDDVLHTEDMVEGFYKGYITFLGFHPYKEIAFLELDLTRAVAYHWNTGKFQDLGDIYPKNYAEAAGHVAQLVNAFIYTPCWMEDFPENKLEARIED